MTCKLLILPGSKKRPPNGAKRGPEAAWISKDRWERVPEELQEKLAPLCPDFVIELVSPSDRSADVEEKWRNTPRTFKKISGRNEQTTANRPLPPPKR